MKIAGCQKEQIYSSLSFEASLASTNDTVVAAILAWAGSVINWMIFLYHHNRDHDNGYECEKGISPQKTRGLKVFITCKLLARPFVISQFKYAVVLFMFLSTIMCNLKRLEMHSWSLKTAELENNKSCWIRVTVWWVKVAVMLLKMYKSNISNYQCDVLNSYENNPPPLAVSEWSSSTGSGAAHAVQWQSTDAVLSHFHRWP